MPAKNGILYLDGLRAHPKNLWIEGEKVTDVTQHVAFSRSADSLAALYDMQYDPKISSEMTLHSNFSDISEGLSFITPTSQEHLIQRGKMMLNWARFSGGILARTPDYMNVIIMACAAASEFFGQYGENIWNSVVSIAVENDRGSTDFSTT